MSYPIVPTALPEGVSEYITAIIGNDGRMNVTIAESQYNELVQGFKQLLAVNARLASTVEYKNRIINDVNAIREEFRQSVEENEIEDSSSEIFSLDDVNRIFDALNLETIETMQEHSFEVTVVVTATVSKRGYDVDSLRDELEDEVRNIHFELFEDYIDSSFEVESTDTDVSVSSN